LFQGTCLPPSRPQTNQKWRQTCMEHRHEPQNLSTERMCSHVRTSFRPGLVYELLKCSLGNNSHLTFSAVVESDLPWSTYVCFINVPAMPHRFQSLLLSQECHSFILTSFLVTHNCTSVYEYIPYANMYTKNSCASFKFQSAYLQLSGRHLERHS
jgi:hypothetical protein